MAKQYRNPAKSLTNVQRRMYEVLNDGEKHEVDELKKCLHDPLGNNANVHAHIKGLRKYLRVRFFDIVCIREADTIYFRMLAVYNGKPKSLEELSES